MNDWHRQNDDGEICEDVDGCIRAEQMSEEKEAFLLENLQPHRKLVDTMCGLARPKGLNWDTCEDAAEHSPACVAYYYSQYSIVCKSELLRSEYTAVLQKHRTFREAQ